MSCPLLRRSHPPACRAVAGAATALDRQILAAYCRGPYGDCPAYRYVRAAGRLLHPADFRAWVIQGVGPGRVDPTPDAPFEPDAA